MIRYTRVAFNKVVGDLKSLSRVLSFSVPALSLIYLVYCLIVNSGIFVLNVVASVVTLSYMIFYAVYCVKIEKAEKGRARKLKSAKRTSKRVYKILRLTINAITLGVAVYGIYFTAQDVTLISVALVGLLLVFWVLNLLIALAYEFVQSRVDLIIDGIQYDMERLNPVRAVKDAVSRIQGKEIEVDTDKISQKSRDTLDALVEKEMKKKGVLNQESPTRKFFKRVFGTDEEDTAR